MAEPTPQAAERSAVQKLQDRYLNLLLQKDTIESEVREKTDILSALNEQLEFLRQQLKGVQIATGDHDAVLKRLGFALVEEGVRRQDPAANE